MWLEIVHILKSEAEKERENEIEIIPMGKAN